MKSTTAELLMAACLVLPVMASPNPAPKNKFYCPPTGPVLPAPVIPSDFAKRTSLKKTFQDLVKDSKSAFSTEETSFSVTITTPGETIFEYHHAADELSETGTQHVDGNTVYRIASVTKVFTTLSAMLQEGLDFDDYAWQHIPELKGLQDYKEITVRMLASHVSGIVRDGKQCAHRLYCCEHL